MPLIPRRRSTLDLLTDDLRALRDLKDNNKDVGSAAVSDPAQSLPRPQSENGLKSTPFGDRAGSPPLVGDPKPKRFSMRLSRHFSDSALSTKMMLVDDQSDAPPVPTVPAVPPPPAIMMTAPTQDLNGETAKKKSRVGMFKRSKSNVSTLKSPTPGGSRSPANEHSKSVFHWGRKSHETRRTVEGGGTPDTAIHDGSSSPRPISPTLTASSLRARKSSEHPRSHSPKAKKSMFGLPKRDKRKSLFPIPVMEPAPQYPDTAPATPRESTSGRSQRSGSPVQTKSPVKKYEGFGSADFPSLHLSASQGALPKNNVTFAAPGFPLLRHDSNRSTPSTNSSPNLGPPRRLGVRDRASTNSTFGRPSEDMTPPTPPTLNDSTRNSTSTAGRASLGNFLTLNRFRNAENASRHDSQGNASKANSVQINREIDIKLPEREDGETAAKYLERLQTLVSRNVIAGVLSKSTDAFFQNVLRSYTRRFAFFGEPIDMSLRKFLLEAELPKETQQVDRVIQAFADRYHECNPGIFVAPDQAYIIAFSLMMLHTDAFNKNNKYKMQKQDYIKNTRGQYVSEDVLACFYDNICYTPFIHFDEDDFDSSADRLSTFKSKKAKLKGAMPDPSKKSTGPVDPYYLIIENKLDVLRPSLKESIVLEDPYNYLGTAKSLDLLKIQRAFHNTGILQIISARSRPAAFESDASRDNPEESKPGVIDLQVTKVGIIWRKSAKRKKTRSPWQEWGAILTGSQLYFFKNVSWVKNLMQQYNTHQKHMVPPSPVIFHPPLEEFKPDSLIKTDDAVALVDATYNRHKNAFTLIRHGGEEEVLLADTEPELNEWLALINYAAAFRSAGVRIRGFTGINSIEQPPPLRRLNTSKTLRQGDEAHQRTTSVNPTLAKQIMAARRRQMVAKIAEAEIKITDTNKSLDTMLRNARHLLVLAPIQPRTREMIIHSAAKMDAVIKWTRREIWRTKCYKDILYMDALEDNDDIKDEAARMRPISMVGPEPAQDPQSVVEIITPAQQDGNGDAVPGLQEGLQTHISIPGLLASDDDVFRTPPESMRTGNGESFAWHLPPIELPAHAVGQPAERRQSVSSAVPSTVSAGRRPSCTQLSSTSSMHDMSRLSPAGTVASPSDRPSSVQNSLPITPNSQTRVRDPLVHTLTATTTASSAVRRLSDAGVTSSTVSQATPDSGHRPRSHRRSLHRSLRDGFHESGSIHRHRKGKDSASTVKSDGAAHPETEDVPEGTPGLERQEGRFMLHGKQASVITFGDGWEGGVIRMPTTSKRETSIRDGDGPGFAPSDGRPEAVGGAANHARRLQTVDDDANETSGSDHTERHALSSRTESFSEQSGSITGDALVAQAYAAGFTPRHSMSSDDDGEERGAGWYDARSTDDLSKYSTPRKEERHVDVIGGSKESAVDGEVEEGKENRPADEKAEVGARPESGTLGAVLGVVS